MTAIGEISHSALLSQIKVWEDAQRDIARKADTLKAQSAKYEKLIAQATKTVELLGQIEGLSEGDDISVLSAEESPQPNVEEPQPTDSTPSAAHKAKKVSRVGYGLWEREIVPLAWKHPDGISYPDIKKLLSAKLQKKAASSDKAFNSAILKMVKKGSVVRHNEHVFIPDHYERFMHEVDMGVKQDVSSKRRGPLGKAPVVSAVMMILSEAEKPLKGGDVVKEVIKMPVIGPAAERNHTGVYNVLSRLVKQGKIAKDEIEKTYFIPSEEEEETGSGNDEPASEPVAGGGQRSLLNGSGMTLGSSHSAHS